MKPNQERDIYYIPPNFLTSGRLFGGTIRIRNAIEAGILVVLTGLPIIQLPLSLTARIIILCLITLPLGIFGVIGIEGDALSEFLISFIKWLKNRRKLFRSDTAEQPPAPQSKSHTRSHQPPEQLGMIHAKFAARPTFEDDEQVVAAFTEFDRLTKEIQMLQKQLSLAKAKL